MAASVAWQDEKQGIIQPLVSRSPFSVEDSDSVWIVQSGKLDLFLVGSRDGELVGARHHVLQVRQGQAVFGIGHHLKDMSFVAVGSPDTALICHSLDSIRSMAASPGSPALLLLEEWITNLTRALSDDSPLGQTMLLEPGKVISIPPPTRAIFPKRGLVWAVHCKGISIFRNAFPQYAKDPSAVGKFMIDGSSIFPVTKAGWLQATPGSEIDCVPSDSLHKVDPEWRGLQKFHVASAEYLSRKLQQVTENEQARGKARVEADTNTFSTALLQLTSPLRKAGEVPEAQQECRNPVFLACAAIGKRLGVRIKPHPDMLRGLRVADPIGSIARSSGVRIRTVLLKGEWWRQDAGPLLAIREEKKTPVALLPRSPSRYEFYDPVDHHRGAVDSEFAGTLSPFAYMLYRPFPAKKLGVLELLKFGWPLCKRELGMISLMGLAAGLLGMVTPIVTGVVFDRLIPGAERSELVVLSSLLLIIALSTAMFTFTRGVALLRMEGKLDAYTESAVWDRLLSLPASFFRDYSSGDLAQRSLGINAIRQALAGATSSSMFSAVFSMFSFGLMFYYSVSLSVLASGLILLAFVVTLGCGIFQVRMQRQMAMIGGKISSMLLQFIVGIAKFRVSGTEGRAFAVWAKEFAKKKVIATKARQISMVTTIFFAVFPTFCLGTIFYYQQSLAAEPGSTKITTGDFFAFFSAFSQVMAAVVSVSAAIIAVVAVIPFYERAKPIFNAIPEVTEAKTSPGRLTGAIEVSHVTFRYAENAPPALRDVSISARPGQFIAIVGASGSGKSTLLRLLLGFEAPESGAVYFDGQDLSGLDTQEVRRQMGVVLQSSRPISGSIFQNIVGSAPLTVEDAWEAARLAGIDEDIRKMPMQLHTYLSDGGGGISGGQRQRLMIARAIAPRPRIVLFDEATSALDNQTQAIVSRSLDALQATRIVIAHRLSTIMNATRIFVLDKGEVVQSGTYQELISQDGVFKELAKRQMF